MDATQKQKIRRVAKIHFALSVLSGLLFLIIAPLMASAKTHSEPNYVCAVFFFAAMFSFFLLQPQFLVIQFLFAVLRIKIDSIDLFLGFIIAPFWSYAFAWIFIRIKDWLNHFPVLGTKIF